MPIVTPSQFLQAARDQIADPAHWTQRTYARDMLGQPISTSSKGAVAFCAIGSLIKIRHVCGLPLQAALQAGGPLEKHALDFLYQAARIRGWNYVAMANDTAGHTEVLAIYDEAIALALAEEQKNESTEAPLFATSISLSEPVLAG